MALRVEKQQVAFILICTISVVCCFCCHCHIGFSRHRENSSKICSQELIKPLYCSVFCMSLCHYALQLLCVYFDEITSRTRIPVTLQRVTYLKYQKRDVIKK